jgi:predicted flap endonuclease-1-like 5' DNA nuclease
MSYKIKEIEGIGPVFAAKLIEAGIKTTGSLLKSCGDPSGRETLSEKTTISPHLLLKWTNMADLMRISGIGRQFAELLEASGVDTVKELKHRLADNLAAKMAEVNAEKRLCRVSPSSSTVAKWIEQAGTLEAAIRY